MAAATVQRGRELYQQRSWAESFAQLGAADLESPLEGTDLELLATAAFLCGDDQACDDAGGRAYRFYLEHELPLQAARAAFWLAFGLMNRGETAQAGGWLGRAKQLVGEHREDCVEHGYLIIPEAVMQVHGGNPEPGLAAATEALELAERFHEPDLATLARLLAGEAQLLLGDTGRCFEYLDAAMVAVTAGEVSPPVAGLAYCAVIEACRDLFDVRRAREWTLALTRWCEAQPDLVPYRGLCLVHRSEIMEFDGSWRDALQEAERACRRLSDQAPAGAAFYRIGELHRLRGEFREAEDAYRKANQRGHEPQPGLVLLRLAQGEVAAAEAGARRLFGERAPRHGRAQVLVAYVEVMLALPDIAQAREAADELTGLAGQVDVPVLNAYAAQATGAILLAEGDAAAAVVALRSAWKTWRELESPYQAARVRVLLGSALRVLGDEDSAQLAFDAARWVFEQLGAAPDLAHTDALIGAAAAQAAGTLTPREVEVLRLVAAGRSNRDMAGDLFLSEKTIARHVSNIYAKLDLSSRAAATAYAYEHGLV